MQEIGVDALVLEALDPQDPLRAAEHVGKHRQIGGSKQQLANLETVDVHRGHDGRAGKAGDARGRGRHDAKAEGCACGDGRTCGAGIHHEAIRALAIDQHRRPDAADAVPPRRRDELGLGGLNDDFFQLLGRAGKRCRRGWIGDHGLGSQRGCQCQPEEAARNQYLATMHHDGQ